jgi:hypothetical protein
MFQREIQYSHSSKPVLHPVGKVAKEVAKFGYFETTDKVAEREGFEPSVPLRTHMISNHAHSTTLPPLRVPDELSFRQGKGQSKDHQAGEGQMLSPDP